MCPGFHAILAAVIISLFLSFTDGGHDEGTISDQNRALSSCVTLFLCGNLTLMYFPCIDPSDGSLVSMTMVPMRIKNFRLNHASSSEARWLRNMLNREGKRLGTGVISDEKGYFLLEWD